MENIEIFFTSRSRLKKPKTKNVSSVVRSGSQIADHGGGSPWRHTKTGYRADLDMVLRSGWEANVARVFRCYEIDFAFEPHVFTFPIKRGTRSYTPDFFLSKTNEWVEVKGYFDEKSRIKLKRFKKYYPEEFAKMTLIIGSSKQSLEICNNLEVEHILYPHISKFYRAKIPNWEGS